ncbi:MAG: hypothetical protein ACREQ5_35285 [Candidatus Dormibacteria bacterium]
MNVRPLAPNELDAPIDGAPALGVGRSGPPTGDVDAPFAGVLERALATTGVALERADRAERAFAGGRGGLAEMIFERAQADVMLAVAASAASRTAQGLSTILNMPV